MSKGIISSVSHRGTGACLPPHHIPQVEDCGIDLVVCDEAHKLKNDEAWVTRARRQCGLVWCNVVQESAYVDDRLLVHWCFPECEEDHTLS